MFNIYQCGYFGILIYLCCDQKKAVTSAFQDTFTFRLNTILSVAIELQHSMTKILWSSVTLADDRRKPHTYFCFHTTLYVVSVV